MIKAKQRIEKLEKKTGGTKRSIIAMAHCRRVTRIFDAETHEDMPEHKERIGMDMDVLRKSLAAYYKDREAETDPVGKILVINSAVPPIRARTSPELEVVNVERIITDDINDIIPGTRQAVERTDKEPSLEAKELSEEEIEEDIKKTLADMTDEEKKKFYEKAQRVKDGIKDMTDEELDQEIEELGDDELLELAESAGITLENLEAMTEEEIEKKIKEKKKSKVKKP